MYSTYTKPANEHPIEQCHINQKGREQEPINEDAANVDDREAKGQGNDHSIWFIPVETKADVRSIYEYDALAI